MFKKIISILMAAVLSAALIPASLTANAVQTDALPSCDDMGVEGVERDGDFQYKVLDDGTASIYRYYGKSTTCVIPEKLGGKTVSTIGALALSMNSIVTGVAIDEVIIPRTVKKIENSAFSACEISKLNIPANVEEIGYAAFIMCGNLSSITVDANNKNYTVYNNCLYSKDLSELIFCPIGSKGSLKISDSCTQIDDLAFAYCAYLTSIEIPKSVKTLGKGAFGICTGLRTLEIPDSISSIETSTFSNCKDLTVTIPRSVSSIDDNAFIDCENCKILCFKNSAAHRFASKNNIKFTLLAEEPIVQPPIEYGIYGDLDGDQNITSADALIFLRMSVGLAEKSDITVKYADVDNDGIVTAADSLDVLRYSVHLPANEKIGKKD